jgi:hypothetical protein
MCVQLPIQLATMALGNVSATFLFQYLVNMFERPRNWWVLIENHDRKKTRPVPARPAWVPRGWPAGLVHVVGYHWAPHIFSTRGIHLTTALTAAAVKGVKTRSKGARESRLGAREQGSKGASEQGSKGAREQGSKGAREQGSKGAREQAESRRGEPAVSEVKG